jgi:hypothetical protein
MSLPFGGFSSSYTPFGEGIVGPLRSRDILAKIQPLQGQASSLIEKSRDERFIGYMQLFGGHELSVLTAGLLRTTDLKAGPECSCMRIM